MKKVSVVFSILLTASLLLAACGGGTDVEGTPGVIDTPDTGLLLTPTTDLGVVNTPTAMATEPVATQPAVATATTDAAVVATSTPDEVVVDVDMSKSPDRLSALLDYEVRSTNGLVIGEVEGVLVNRNKIVTEDVVDNSTGAAATNTPDAAAAATSTPAAGTGTAVAGVMGGAQITYLVVELNSAFNVVGGETGGALVATNTPDAAAPAAPGATQTVSGLAGDPALALGAGDEILVPLSAFEPLMAGVMPGLADADDDDPALVLTVDDATLASLPVFDRDSLDFMVETWDEEFQAFWSGQNVTIPVTGEVEDTAAGFETVLLTDNFAGINVVNTNDDDLGEVEDFILDPATGEFHYAILATGGFLGIGEKWIAVPMQLVYWIIDDDVVEDPSEREVDEVGEILINVPEEAFESAPAFDNFNEVDTTLENWASDIEAFWQTYGFDRNR
jgi:sporulation protein YlmC with PRC-barrel domain